MDIIKAARAVASLNVSADQLVTRTPFHPFFIYPHLHVFI